VVPLPRPHRILRRPPSAPLAPSRQPDLPQQRHSAEPHPRAPFRCANARTSKAPQPPGLTCPGQGRATAGHPTEPPAAPFRVPLGLPPLPHPHHYANPHPRAPSCGAQRPHLKGATATRPHHAPGKAALVAAAPPRSTGGAPPAKPCRNRMPPVPRPRAPSHRAKTRTSATTPHHAPAKAALPPPHRPARLMAAASQALPQPHHAANPHPQAPSHRAKPTPQRRHSHHASPHPGQGRTTAAAPSHSTGSGRQPSPATTASRRQSPTRERLPAEPTAAPPRSHSWQTSPRHQPSPTPHRPIRQGPGSQSA
jgi:hypothetical protein